MSVGFCGQWIRGTAALLPQISASVLSSPQHTKLEDGPTTSRRPRLNGSLVDRILPLLGPRHERNAVPIHQCLL
ncbi:hypothetical protein C8Q70DRAFT_359127 [Cubamyces menziesii]|nr:hypothetical protein C8Q70DRAFT_359127 [Cubamyces menziesii]